MENRTMNDEHTFKLTYNALINIASLMKQQQPNSAIIKVLREKIASSNDIHKIMCIVTDGMPWYERMWELL